MARQLHKLNALQVSKLTRPGRHGDGGGLYLSIDENRRRWVFMFRDRRTKKLREMGLGSATDVTLAKAREKAATARAALADGKDPFIAARTASSVVPTFGEVATEFMESMQRQWRNEKHRDQWRMTLEIYGRALWDRPVDSIGVEDVLAVLKPHWERRPETAGRLRGRIERVLNAAKAAGHRTGENPAVWRGHLENLLAARPKLSRGHHRALHWRKMPDFIAAVREREGVAALALEFLILTATRSAEARFAAHDEFDLEHKIWTIPAQRMKAGREHRVPLVDRALEILKQVEPLVDRAGLVFPGGKQGRPLSDVSLLAVLKRMKVNCTPHGFRSSFKDWATESTSFPNEISEAALAHVTGDRTERAYRRGDALDRRRELMEAWARFCSTLPATVVTFRKSTG
jgi:integrase